MVRSGSRTLQVALFVFGFWGWMVFPPGASAEEIITSAQRIRSLTPAEAEQAVPVHLRGVVTVLSTFRNSFFFADSSGGISIDRDGDTTELHPGDRVEVVGHSSPGLYAPMVMATKVKVVGSGKLPAPRPVHFHELLNGKEDSQWVEVEGLVRSASVRTEWQHRALVLETDVGAGKLVAVRVLDFSGGGWEKLAGAYVRFRGACASVFNQKRQLVGVRLLLSSLQDVQVLRPASSNVFDLPLRPLQTVLQFGEEAPTSGPVRMRGVVTFAQEANSLFLQEGQRGMYVRTAQPGAVELGSVAEVVGYPAPGDYSPILDGAVFRVVPGKQTIAPIAAKAEQMIVMSDHGFWSAPYDALLVQLTAQVVDQIGDQSFWQLILQEGSVVFRAKLPKELGKLPKYAPGTVLRVTGICGARIDDLHQVRMFQLLLRNSGDVVVVKAVPWWHSVRAGWTAALCLFLAMIVGTVLLVVRHQRELRKLAMTDPLTGLYNRRAFLMSAERDWLSAVRKESPLTLFYIDVDHFKEINDTYGHHAGDLALQAVAGALRACFRAPDLIGRMGGDEFAVMCDSAVEPSPELAERIQRRLSDPHHRQLPFEISLSIGTFRCDPWRGDMTLAEVIGKADAQMYSAKRGRAASKQAV